VNQTEQLARQLVLVDSALARQMRVNGSVENFDEFGEAFWLQQGPAYVPGEFLPRLVGCGRSRRPFAGRRSGRIR